MKTEIVIDHLVWSMDEVDNPEDALAELPKAPVNAVVPTSVLHEDGGVADALADAYGFAVLELSYHLKEPSSLAEK